jgi:hypothetical protein
MWAGLAAFKAAIEMPVRADRRDHESPGCTVYQ